MTRAAIRAAAAAACLAATAAAADDARWYVRIDNDFFFHTDRWYTAGERIARVSDGIEWAITQEIYTPEAAHFSPTLQDRAPTGRLFGSVAKHMRDEDTFDTLELALGVRGPSALGEQAQDLAHHLSFSHGASVDWERQLPDAVDASATLARSQTLGFGFKGHVGAVVGTQVTFAHAGLEWRYGAAQAQPSALLRFAATPPFEAAAQGWSAYVGASARGIVRNELLSKNYYVYGPDLVVRKEVTRVASGAAWSGGWGELTFDIAQDSREFEGQRAAHAFGSFALHVPF